MSLLNIKRNQIKMVKARGYDTSHEDWILDDDIDEHSFKEKLCCNHNIRELLTTEYSLLPNKHILKSKQLYVSYVGLTEGNKLKLMQSNRL